MKYCSFKTNGSMEIHFNPNSAAESQEHDGFYPSAICRNGGTVGNTYQKGEPASDCPSQYVVTTEEECKAAAAEIGYPYNSQSSNDERPPGCFWNDATNPKLIFNTNFDGTANSNNNLGAVCLTGETTTTSCSGTEAYKATATTNCPSEDQITLLSDCLAAAEEIGYDFDPVEISDS